jgi:hypothetical protein
MIRKKITQHLYTQLPAYINGALNPTQKRIVAFWLKRDEQARITAENLQTLQTAVRRQPRRGPSPAVLGKIQAQIHSQQTASSRTTPQRAALQRASLHKPALGFPILLLSIVTLILAATIMWQALPPGIVLQWSVEGQAPATYRVYRAAAGSEQIIADNQFKLLDEVSAAGRDRQYTFTDIRLLPGQNYVYRVEGLTAAGQPAASQTITGRAIDALPGQLAMLLVFIFCGYVVWTMFQQWRPMTTAAI